MRPSYKKIRLEHQPSVSPKIFGVGTQKIRLWTKNITKERGKRKRKKESNLLVGDTANTKIEQLKKVLLRQCSLEQSRICAHRPK